MAHVYQETCTRMLKVLLFVTVKLTKDIPIYVVDRQILVIHIMECHAAMEVDEL